MVDHSFNKNSPKINQEKQYNINPFYYNSNFIMNPQKSYVRQNEVNSPKNLIHYKRINNPENSNKPTFYQAKKI